MKLLLQMDKLDNPANYMKTHFRIVAVDDVVTCHRLKPCLTQLWSAGVRLGQAVLQVNIHLRVVAMFFHSRRRHQHCPNALRQVLYFRWKICSLTTGNRLVNQPTIQIQSNPIQAMDYKSNCQYKWPSVVKGD